MGAVLTLMILGTLLLFAEVVVPGGVLGTIGVVCFFGAAFAAWKAAGAGLAALVVLAAILLSMLAVFAWGYVLPKTKFGGKILPKPDVPDAKGGPLDSLLGKECVALTKMLPSGKVKLDGGVFDASCVDGSASEGDLLVVVSADLGELKVRKLSKP